MRTNIAYLSEMKGNREIDEHPYAQLTPNTLLIWEKKWLNMM